MATKVDNTASMLCRKHGCQSERTVDLLLAAEKRVGELEAALGSFLGWFDRRYPGGEGSDLPGLTLWSIAEDARAALANGDEAT